MGDLLIGDAIDGVATLTLNRPQTRNALSLAMLNALIGAFNDLAKDDRVRVVIVAGAGPTFCAGHDLKELHETGFAPDFCQLLFERCAEVMLAIVGLAKPVIAQVQGVATAAGCQLVASCDLAVAAEDAQFATPGVNIGLFCSTPMVAISRTVGRKAALRMALTGDMIDADRAVEIGLINQAVPPAELADYTQALARQIASKSPLTLAIGKQAFYRQIELALVDAYEDAGRVMAANLATRDAQEGIAAFLDKRPPVWQGR